MICSFSSLGNQLQGTRKHHSRQSPFSIYPENLETSMDEHEAPCGCSPSEQKAGKPSGQCFSKEVRLTSTPSDNTLHTLCNVQSHDPLLKTESRETIQAISGKKFVSKLNLLSQQITHSLLAQAPALRQSASLATCDSHL